MDVQNIYSMISKDFTTFSKKKTIIYSVVILPLAFSAGFPAIMMIAKSRGRLTKRALDILIPTFSFSFAILAALTPVIIAGYSLVGEKLENSLEPLLATPLSDGEILLGKSIVAVVPSLIAIYVSATIFTILMNAVTYNAVRITYLPDTNFIYIIFLIVPLTTIYSVEVMVLVSSRVNDIRTSSQIGMLPMLPLVGIYVLSQTNNLTLDKTTLIQLASVIVILDIILFFLARIVFQREKILTRWK